MLHYSLTYDQKKRNARTYMAMFLSRIARMIILRSGMFNFTPPYGEYVVIR